MSWWRNLSQNGRGFVAVLSLAAGALGTAFALGAATRSTVEGHRELPQRVQAVELRVDRLDSAVVELQGAAEISEHKWAVLDTLSASVAEVQCILRAQVEGANPARCLPTYGGRR